MKRIAGLFALLLIAGCAAPASVATPAAPAVSSAPAAGRATPQSMPNPPMDTGTIAVPSGDDAGVDTAESVLARYRYLLPY